MSVLLAVLVVAGFPGCQARNLALPSVLMDPHDSAALPSVPLPDVARVVFLRPSELGYSTQAVVYGDDEFLGVVMRDARLVHDAKPGLHRYMVVSEAADFVDAELRGGTLYFIEVAPRVGAWRARFSLLPITPNRPQWARLSGWLADSRLETPNALGWEWARNNASSVKAKTAKYLPEWLAKPDRPVIYPQDGVDHF